MFHQLRNELQQEEGFTLIELLVVILIIGILAAIAIPSFLNQRYKGQDACAKSMAKQMQTAAETYQTDNNSYVGLGLVSLNTIESSISANGGCATGAAATGAQTAGLNAAASGACQNAATATAYCVASKSATGTIFNLINNAGVVTRSCVVPAGNNKGGCPSGTW